MRGVNEWILLTAVAAAQCGADDLDDGPSKRLGRLCWIVASMDRRRPHLREMVEERTMAFTDREHEDRVKTDDSPLLTLSLHFFPLCAIAHRRPYRNE